MLNLIIKTLLLYEFRNKLDGKIVIPQQKHKKETNKLIQTQTRDPIKMNNY